MSLKPIDGGAVIVGRLGMHQLGAVGLSNMVFFFVTVFFSFLLVVTTPRVADALALNNRREVCGALKSEEFPFGQCALKVCMLDVVLCIMLLSLEFTMPGSTLE